ncbi:MAG: molecular chaperone TorD family protein [Candidatus Tectomicrobia bacterium]|nr:molecular chaperone TorD family protein [Candidatus Tectomicrobia bacterium]
MGAPESAIARSATYDLLSLAFLYPEAGHLDHLREAVPQLQEAAGEIGWDDVARALRGLGAELRTATREALETEFAEVFGHGIPKDCPPYEGEYNQAHIYQKVQTLAELKGVYEHFGLAPNPDLKDRPDHISVELEFMQALTAKEAYARLQNHGDDKISLCREAQKCFLEQHLAGWTRRFARALAGKTQRQGVYGALALLLGAYMERELQEFGLTPSLLPVLTDIEEEGDAGCPGCDA